MVKNIGIGLLFWLLPLTGFGQNLLGYTTVDTNSAYIGQPVVLKVSVYTTTWFTKGVNIGNIQVDGALTVYFRSVSNSKTINGEKYAGVDFYYNLFPTQEGVLHIPSLDIQVETPKEGDFKGIKRIVKTKPKSITVTGVPLGYDPNNWLVATDLTINQKWSASLKTVKVGDVIQRTINRFAGGTLAEFIPETKFDSIYGISIYPKRPQVKTNKSRTDVSSQRIETVNYLFEKEGEVTLPAITYVYWNSNNKKFYQKQIDSIQMLVKPNADLKMLASIKKSLQNEKIEETSEESQAFLIFGLSPLAFLKYALLTLVALIIGFKLLKYLLVLIRKKHTNYLISERYAFKKLKKSLLKDDHKAFFRTTNLWLKKLNTSNSLDEFIQLYGTKNMKRIIDQNNEAIFKNNEKGNKPSFHNLVNEFKNARIKFFLQQKSKNNSKTKGWLNPVSID